MSDTNKMAEEFRAMLQELLSEKKEEADVDKVTEMVRKAESTVAELSEIVAGKSEEVANLTEEATALKVKVEELEAEVKAAQEKETTLENSLKEAEERANKAEESLASIEKDRALELRVKELEEAKILRKGERLDQQKAQVRDMSDEEFAAYKVELCELRAEIEESLKAVAEEAEVEEVEEVEEESVDVSPADVSNLDQEQAAAALDVEVEVDDTEDQWKEFAAAISKRIRDAEKAG